MPELRNSKQIRIGVKYCGGCNPRYDRRAAYMKISGDVRRWGLESFAEKKGKEIVFETAEEGASYDALLVVCGCANRCAAISQYRSMTAPVYVWDETGIADAVKALVEIIGG